MLSALSYKNIMYIQHQNFQELLDVLLEYFPLASETAVYEENRMAFGLRLHCSVVCHRIFEICEHFSSTRSILQMAQLIE